MVSDEEPPAPVDQYDYDLNDSMPPPEAPFVGFKQGNRVVITKDLIKGGLMGMSGTVNHRVMSTGDLNSVQGEVVGYFGVDLSHRTEHAQFLALCYLRLDCGIEMWMDEVNLAKEGSKRALQAIQERRERRIEKRPATDYPLDFTSLPARMRDPNVVRSTEEPRFLDFCVDNPTREHVGLQLKCERKWGNPVGSRKATYYWKITVAGIE